MNPPKPAAQPKTVIMGIPTPIFFSIMGGTFLLAVALEAFIPHPLATGISVAALLTTVHFTKRSN